MQLWHGLWMLVPGAAVYAYMKPSQNEEALAAQLRANYARNVRDAKAKRSDMQRYFDGMKSGDAAQAKTMAGTLQGGTVAGLRDGVKRPGASGGAFLHLLQSERAVGVHVAGAWRVSDYPLALRRPRSLRGGAKTPSEFPSRATLASGSGPD